METGSVEGPWELPEGWRWEPLGSLAEFINGAAFKPTDWVDEGMPIIRIQNLTDPDKPLNRTLRNPGERYRIASGDLLVSWSATLDAFVWKRGDAWLNQHIFKVIPESSRADADFLFYLLKHEIENLKKSEHLHGSTMKHINRGPFLAHVVPVPTLETQRRIAAQIEELFSEMDDGEAALSRARADLETYRKSLLKAAVTGELTADWRAANPPAETGEQLLRRIQAERKARWEADPKNKGKRYKEPILSEELGANDLPTSWTLVPASLIAEWSSGKFLPSKAMVVGSVPVFGGNGINGSHKEALLNDQTLVVGRVGHYCGSVYVTPGPSWVTDNAIYASWLSNELDPSFLRLVFTSARLREQAQGGAQPFVSQAMLSAVAVPVPSRAEQTAIVEAFDAATETIQSVVAHCDGPGTSELRQSILAAAFRGELVE